MKKKGKSFIWTSGCAEKRGSAHEQVGWQAGRAGSKTTIQGHSRGLEMTICTNRGVKKGHREDNQNAFATSMLLSLATIVLAEMRTGSSNRNDWGGKRFGCWGAQARAERNVPAS